MRWVENGLIEALGSLGFPSVRRDTPRGGSSLVGTAVATALGAA